MIFARTGGMGSVFEGDETVPFEKKDTPFEAKKAKGRGRKRGWKVFNAITPVDTEANVIYTGTLPAEEQALIEQAPVLVDETGRVQMKPKNRVRRYNREADFVPARETSFPTDDYGDIRAMGPLELPDYTERQPSALGRFGRFGQAEADAAAAAAAAAAASTASQPWYASIAKAVAPIATTAMEVYKSLKTAKAPKAAAPTTVYVQQPTPESKGLPTWGWIAIIGGGVVLFGGAAIWYFNKK